MPGILSAVISTANVDGESTLEELKSFTELAVQTNVAPTPRWLIPDFSPWYMRKSLPFSEHHRLSGVIKQSNGKL